MQIVVTAVGPDHQGLADPIIHAVTGFGANISEIQMYDHDEERVFAMLCRAELEREAYSQVEAAMKQIAGDTGLSVRVWSPELRAAKPRLAICTTFRQEPPLALLRAIRDKEIKAEAALMIGNRANCRGLAEQFGVPWEMIGDKEGRVDDDEMIALCDKHDIDYVVLARYMRILPAASCWKLAGGRIINLHHGLLPSFKGIRPYHDAYAARMLTFGATCHFIVPELDAGNQIIQQATFTVPPGTPLTEIIRIGQEDNEPRCLVEGVKRVVNREVQLHFHRIVATKK